MTLKSVPSRYSRAVRKAFAFWPVWLPDAPVSVGDAGRIIDGVFFSEGKLDVSTELVEVARARPISDQYFSSDGVRQLNLELGAGSAVADIGTRIEFGQSFGVLMALRGCRELRIQRSAQLASVLAHRIGLGQIARDKLVVTGVIEARSALIVVSSGKGAKLDLSSSVGAGDILSRLDGELRVAGESNLAYRAVIKGTCTPLLVVSRVVAGNELVPRGPEGAATLREVDPRTGLE